MSEEKESLYDKIQRIFVTCNNVVGSLFILSLCLSFSYEKKIGTEYQKELLFMFTIFFVISAIVSFIVDGILQETLKEIKKEDEE